MDGHNCQRTQSRSLSVSCLHPPHAPASPSVRSHLERPFRYSLTWLLLYTWQCIVQLKANHGKQWLSPFTASPRQKQASKALALRKLLIWLVRQQTLRISMSVTGVRAGSGRLSEQGTHQWQTHIHRSPRGARHGEGRYTEPLATRAGFTEEKRKTDI